VTNVNDPAQEERGGIGSRYGPPGIGARVLRSAISVHFFLLLVTACFLLPLVWMVLTALKPVDQTMRTPHEWVPRAWTAPLKREPGAVISESELAATARIPVDKMRKLEAPEALLVAGLSADEKPGQGKFEGQRMLVKAEDVRATGGEWGIDLTTGEGAMRYRLGIEREKRIFDCEILAVYPAGSWLVREYVPDLRQVSKPAGKGEEVPYAWGVVPESALEQRPALLWENVPAALARMDFWRMLLNTLWVCILGMIGTTFASALAAYGFAFGRFPGRGLLFGLTLATMMVPFPATMVPLFQLYRDLGWIGTFKPLWVHCWFGAAFNIFLLRQFFLGLPKDLLDAARIDGCSELEIFWHVVVPLSKPALAMVALFHFLYAWKDFMAPLLYLNDKSQFTLSLGLHAFQSQQGGTPWHLVMAASAVFSLPLIVLFLATMKTFIRGIAMTGIKG